MLKGKTALITGGASGIGLATAKLLIAQGARVAITGRDEAKLHAAREKLGTDTLALVADVCSRTALQSMANDVQQAFAGVWRPGYFLRQCGRRLRHATVHDH